MNKYGNIITSLRQEKGINREALANILLMPQAKYEAVERGSEALTETQLNFCANMFNVSADALKEGSIKPRATQQELLGGLSRFAQLYRSAVESQSYMLGIINDLIKNERFEVRIHEEEIYGFGIYDMENGDFVKDKDVKVLHFDTAQEALEAAGQLEAKSREHEKEESVTDSVTFNEEKPDKTSAYENERNLLEQEDKDIHIKM